MGRALIGFLLRHLFRDGTFQFTRLLRNLFFNVTQ